MNQKKQSGTQTRLTYKSAGVNIDAAAQLVEHIRPIAAKTRRPEVMSGLGGFGALCQIPGHYKNPVLVTGADGVGTKLKLAIACHQHQNIGIDLVAMCVNDLLVTGAEPLQFLDYYATGKLDIEVATQVIAGIGAGCEQAGCALVGGETAEMPGMYKKGDYDLAGFCLGVVEKAEIISGVEVRAGSQLLALRSSGLHSNGYALVRKILQHRKIDPLTARLGRRPLANVLLEPTRIYVKQILQLRKNIELQALAHITGGGLLENLPRILPEKTCARIDRCSWRVPQLFGWLQEQGDLDETEMRRTFNCGIGMVLVVPEAQAQTALDLLQANGEKALHIGQVARRDPGAPQVVFN